MEQKLNTHVQQPPVTDGELRIRLQLLGVTAEHAAALQALRGRAWAESDAMVAEFYHRQLSIPAVRSIISDPDTFLRLCATLRVYILRMFEGRYDLPYANSRLRVGRAHARIGMPPKLYVSALHTLEELLLDRVARGNEIARQALRKLFLLDLQLAFDAHIQGLVDEVAEARDEFRTYSESLEEVIRERTAEAARQALTDPLSGLRTRRGFEEVLQRQLEIARSAAAGLCVVMLDLDGFKQINDTHGHLEGDRIIQVLGQVITAETRAGDYAFRIGGDEFCLILPCTHRAEAMQFCARLSRRFAEAAGGRASFSHGLAALGEAEAPEGPRDLLGRADAELYAMKACRRPEPPRVTLATAG